MQNAADFFFFFWGGGGVRGVFYLCEEYACVLHIILLRAYFHKMWDIGMKYVTYWYQLFTRCDEWYHFFTV